MKILTFIKSNLWIAVAMAPMLMISEVAHAEPLSAIFKRLIISIQDGTSLVGAIGYLVAFVLGLAAIFKFKEYGQDSERHSIKLPIVLLICAALAGFLTNTLTTAKDTIWAGGTSQGSTGSNMSL